MPLEFKNSWSGLIAMVILANVLVIGLDSQKENEMGVSQEVRKRIGVNHPRGNPYHRYRR
ncbi:MAG: hypothetical protein NTX26_03385 [Candidatus Parcubacteria bacterium]|nr:hypothetical protein [Candidatus Parcubacteria bacterium]